MFWKHAWAFAHGGPCGSPPWREHHGRAHEHHKHHQSHSRGGGWGRGPWGVRRPLRFMARQLDLDEDQVTELAAILDDLKMQRAQLKVDRRRAVSVFADVFQEDSFDTDRIQEACKARAESQRLVEEAVGKALERTYALLDKDQRKRLAYLLRSEGLSI